MLDKQTKNYYDQQILPVIESSKQDKVYPPQIKIIHGDKRSNYLSISADKLQKIFNILLESDNCQHRAFKITRLPESESKPERCKIEDLRHKQTAIFSLSGLILDDAVSYLESKKIICSGFSCNSHNGEYYIFTLDFETKIK